MILTSQRFYASLLRSLMFSAIVICVQFPLGLILLIARIDMLNTPVGVALAHWVFNVPIAIWIPESFIAGVPRALDETAFPDGHSTPGFIVKHLIPVIAPGIGAAAFSCFMFSWAEVVFARTLTITDGKPVTTAITSLFGFQTNIGLVMAMTSLSLVPGLVMIWFVRHHLSRVFTVRV